MHKLLSFSLLVTTYCLLLTGCGFQPMYGSHSASQEKSEAGKSMADIEIAYIEDREGQFLRNELIDMLQPRGASQNPAYTLSFSKLDITDRELDLTKSSEATRAQIIAQITISLTDRKTNETVLSRSLRSISSYNILPSEFATNVTEQDATENALRDLARQAQLQLSLYFNR
ncbi:MAG: hypothetical protein DI586_00315 [Micavibrio aeruginosavorus]|uniref:LPS-assembly lipoprotein LptE n=1 Tax=Micavibrio aeruginosavorus TaxID=349221 RepID=A0A2W5FSU6_9BACT|nr:MAG: hypothetical protein DI586_00315 [Micavibrio aeruginosavorus]